MWPCWVLHVMDLHGLEAEPARSSPEASARSIWSRTPGGEASNCPNRQDRAADSSAFTLSVRHIRRHGLSRTRVTTDGIRTQK